jgi:regulator of cell morphogenesis and NO signaling
LLIEYLKHSHFLFVKKRLPYIGQLIDGLSDVGPAFQAHADDLKSIYPLFVEDFVHHIYEEEDTLFSYVGRLMNFVRSQRPVSSVLYVMNKVSIGDFALEHEEHENEMEGFRKFTNDYTYSDDAALQVKVLYSELERFEQDLLKHAKIEDEILFPKALQLEREVKLRFHELAKLN